MNHAVSEPASISPESSIVKAEDKTSSELGTRMEPFAEIVSEVPLRRHYPSIDWPVISERLRRKAEQKKRKGKEKKKRGKLEWMDDRHLFSAGTEVNERQTTCGLNHAHACIKKQPLL
jgi:hypothetical protein